MNLIKTKHSNRYLKPVCKQEVPKFVALAKTGHLLKQLKPQPR